MIETLKDSSTVELVLLIGAIASALVATYKLLLPPGKRFVNWVVLSWSRRTSKYHMIEHIFNELASNGGGTLRDKIDRMEFMLALHNSKQRALLQDVEEGVIETNAEGKIIWANRTYLRKLDITLQDLKGDGWLTYVDPSERQTMIDNWSLAVDKAIDMESETVLNVSGKKVPVHSKAHALKDYQGKLIGHLSIVFFKDKQHA